MPDVINPWWFAPAALLIFGGLAGAIIAHLIRRSREERSQAALDAFAARPDRVDRLVADVLAEHRDGRWLRGDGSPPWEQS